MSQCGENQDRSVAGVVVVVACWVLFLPTVCCWAEEGCEKSKHTGLHNEHLCYDKVGNQLTLTATKINVRKDTISFVTLFNMTDPEIEVL